MNLDQNTPEQPRSAVAPSGESPLDWKAQLLHPRNRDLQVEVLRDRQRNPERRRLYPSPEDGARLLADQLARSEVWDLPDAAVALEVARLARSVPYTDRIAPETIPAPAGVLRLPRTDPAHRTTEDASTVFATVDDGRYRTRVAGLAWGPTMWTRDTAGTSYTAFLSVRRVLEATTHHGDLRLHILEDTVMWPVAPGYAAMCGYDPSRFDARTASEILVGDGVPSAAHTWAGADELRFLLALWALTSSHALDGAAARDRHAAKRARRAGSVNDKVVRVTVPHTRSSGSSGAGSGGSVVAHWVRGHWRWQPVGEGRQDRRLTWIRPHTRGSVGDAPATPGEKVVTVRPDTTTPPAR